MSDMYVLILILVYLLYKSSLPEAATATLPMSIDAKVGDQQQVRIHHHHNYYVNFQYHVVQRSIFSSVVKN